MNMMRKIATDSDLEIVPTLKNISRSYSNTRKCGSFFR